MKHLFFIALFFCVNQPQLFAQKTAARQKGSELSIKGGINIARLSGSSTSFKPEAKNGFMVAAAYSLKVKKGLGYRTELIYSRQGFGFSENGIDHAVSSDYIYMPQFTTFTIAKVVQLHLGGQVGYLLRSDEKRSSSQKLDVSGIMNRFDYGAAGGVEIYPYKGIILGGRYNMSLGNSFKDPSSGSVINPFPFNPSDVKNRNAVINFYIGYKF